MHRDGVELVELFLVWFTTKKRLSGIIFAVKKKKMQIYRLNEKVA